MRHRQILLLLGFLVSACQPAAAKPTAAATQTARPSPDTTFTPGPAETEQPPTSTASAAPAPRSFTEVFDDGLPSWSFVQVDNGQPAPVPKIQAGFLRFDLTAPNQWLYAIYSPQTYTDVRVDTRVVNLGPAAGEGASGSAGIVCRYTQGRGWYEFNIYADQTYVLLYGRWLAPGVPRYTPLVRSQSENIVGGGVNDIGLLCKGNILTPFINGVQMRQREENTYDLASGNIGISAASFEDAPMSIIYDWVRVGEP